MNCDDVFSSKTTKKIYRGYRQRTDDALRKKLAFSKVKYAILLKIKCLRLLVSTKSFH